MASPELEKAFNQSVWYHGTNIAPEKLKGVIKTNASQVISFEPKFTEEWGAHVTPYKGHAAYFSTHWHREKKGYLYSFPKPRVIRNNAWDDPADRPYSPHKVYPTHVENVEALTKHTINPANYSVKDYRFSNKRKLK